MAIKTTTMTITTTPTRIDIDPANIELPTWNAVLVVPSGGATVYLGGPDVDDTTGIPLYASDVYETLLTVDERGLYAVVLEGTQDIRITVFGRGS